MLEVNIVTDMKTGIRSSIKSMVEKSLGVTISGPSSGVLLFTGRI